jgi:hypothetical protein
MSIGSAPRIINYTIIPSANFSNKRDRMTRASGMGSRPKQWVISNGDLLGPSFAAHAQVPERAITSALEDKVLRPVVAEAVQKRLQVWRVKR